MRTIVFGLGSMGKRRIRCLQALGMNDIIGFDIRQDRIEEAVLKYGIKHAFNPEAELMNVECAIISTPPDSHLTYIKEAVKADVPCFVEASVLLEEVMAVKKANLKKTFIAPSCTLKFHPVIKDIKKLVESERYGNLCNFSYHSGQFLPDWHPWENVSDFYVSKRETGGCREIVPFELTWITDVFGFPDEIKGFYGKTTDVGCDIDDTYSFVIKGAKYFGAVTIDVVAQNAIRHLILNFEKAQLLWNWNNNFYEVYDVNKKQWEKVYQQEYKSEKGYNKNIIEDMYIEEIQAFLEGIKDQHKFPNSIDSDIAILQLLNRLEQNDGGFNK